VPPLLIDDHLLVRLLAGIPTERVDAARAGGALWTTGLWYYRAARAVQSPTITGSLSGELSALSAPHRSQAVRSIVRLPDDVGLLSLREIVPVMSELSLTQRLNLLSLEALGAAVHLDADVAVAQENDGRLLREAVSAAGLQYSTL
jgi:hypothetical protein